jgi:molybdenum cofactor cytidylyltransferase
VKLYAALNVQQGDVVAFVGAGGKTSAMVALGYELASAGLRVLATTTTRIAEHQLALMPRAMRPQTQAALTDALSQHRFVFVYDEISAGKVYGPSPTIVSWLLDSMDADVLLVEADGARGLPFKAPKPHEPVIPPETSLVVPVVALTALGLPLDEQHVYNPETMIERYGFSYGGTIKSPWIAQVLRDPELGLKGASEKARKIAFINAVPVSGYLRGRARHIARLALRTGTLDGVAIGDTGMIEPVHEVQRSVGAVVLAAGMSRRMGEPKVLLPWGEGQTIIEHILEQLLLARVDHVTVVTGNQQARVSALAEALGATTVFNAAYETGEMLSSLKAGLRAMPDHIGAALVVLGDQPSIQPRIIQQVMQRYAEGAGDIVAPSYNMRRGHPILIDRRYWREILALPDDGAPRDVINAHADRIAYVEVKTDSVLRDVDTPQDYREERARLRPD